MSIHDSEVLAGTRVLVTGAAGFLGSNLCAALVARGCDVVGIDNYLTGRKENVGDLRRKPGFELVRHDVRQPYSGDFTRIFHLACPASPLQYQRDPIGTAKTNFLGTLNTLDLARRSGARIFHASTSEIYGDPFEHPQRESYWGNVNPVGVRACYDEGKRIAETLALDYHRQHKVDVRIARIFNTYGPRMSKRDGRVVSNFIIQALRNEQVTIFGDGNQTRSFCYVDDLIRGVLLLMNGPRGFNGPVNIGNPEEITIAELAKLVIEITGSRSRIVHSRLPADDPRQRRPDISLANQLLGWRPTVCLRDGVERTVAYFDSVLSSEKAASPSVVKYYESAKLT